jgi:hypothetical protein
MSRVAIRVNQENSSWKNRITISRAMITARMKQASTTSADLSARVCTCGKTRDLMVKCSRQTTAGTTSHQRFVVLTTGGGTI